MPGQWGVVDTDVSPEVARVFLDGRYVGTADDFDGYPDYLYLKPGQYKVEFQLEGFETRTIDVNSRAGAKIEIKEKLAKIPGAKQHGSYDTPQLEGGLQRFWAHDKSSNAPIPVNVEAGDPGPGDIQVQTDQYSDWRGHGSGQQAPPNVDEQAPPQGGYAPPPNGDNVPPPSSSRGRILFHVAPADAAIYVDDRFAGTAEELSSLSRGLQIRPGSHKVVVSRPGFDTQSIQVDVEAGGSEAVQIDLANH
jgi:hypothetical protein